MIFISIFYVVNSLLLAVYGFNSIYLVWLYRKNRKPRQAPPPPVEWPRVTVQLPVYNEMETLERLIEAVAGLDYPLDRFEVQVLDDSTDATTDLAAVKVAGLQRVGLNITHIYRDNRTGFKAGALAAGVKRAQGEFIAIFDADFVPPPDFLRKTLPWFEDQEVGCVQARWGHLNREYSTFTRLQALGVDGHFLIEQVARSRGGLFLNFNGTAGIWRRTCIEDAGGWQHDTLTEDLDLSLRAQLKGWRIEYLPDLVVPGELPAQIAAFKRQQARWARGSLQTARKLLGPLLRSEQPLRVKIEGLIHLTQYMVHPMILFGMILALPMSFSHSPIFGWAPLLFAAAIGPPLMYFAAEEPGGPGWKARLKLIPGMILLGIGLSFNNSRAAFAGLLLRKKGTFQRTPKFALKNRGGRWEHSQYALKQDLWTWGEVLLSIYGFFNIVFLSMQGNLGFLPWLLIYTAGFLYVGGGTLMQAARKESFLRMEQSSAGILRKGRFPHGNS